MKIIFIIFALVSIQSFAGYPHAFDVAPRLLSEKNVQTEVAKYPNYFFASLTFEESDDGWTEHTFNLVLTKYDGAGSRNVCFWVDYDEQVTPHVTRISQQKDVCP